MFFVVVPVCVAQGFELVVGSTCQKPSSIVPAHEDFLSRWQNIGRVPQNSNRIGAPPSEIRGFAAPEQKKIGESSPPPKTSSGLNRIAGLLKKKLALGKFIKK